MLAKIPASCLNQMMLGLPLDASPEGFSDAMSGTERLAVLRKTGHTSPSTSTLVRKLWRLISPDKSFIPYQVIQRMPITPIDFSGVDFSARDYINTGSVAVRGRIHALALPEDLILFVIEFSSRSAYYRQFYRYLIGDSFFLMEQKEDALNLFQELIQPLLIAFDFEPNPISPKHFERTLQLGLPVLEIDLEINDPAVPNLSTLSLTGDNLIRGVKTLRSRQEVDVFKICSKILLIKTSDIAVALEGVTIHTMAPPVLKFLSQLFENVSGSA